MHKEETKVEKSEEGEYTDYELGKDSTLLIVEAKKDAIEFSLPTLTNKNHVGSIEQVIKSCKNANDAIRQAQQYCSSRGVKFAVVTNAKQIIAFVATRVDGKPPLKGKAFIIDSHKKLQQNFHIVFELLSKFGVQANKLSNYLDSNEVSGIPLKISRKLKNRTRYQNESSASLRTVAEILLEDIPRGEDVEKTFYRDCYCDSGPLNQDSLISKNILAARYAALFNSTESSPTLISATQKGGKLTSGMLAEGLAKRPIILLGDVGVGKTSFIRHLQLFGGEKEFQKCISIYIDLGNNATINKDLSEFIPHQLSAVIREHHACDFDSKTVLTEIYKSELFAFENEGIYSSLKNIAPSQFEMKKIEFLEKIIANTEEHLKRCLRYLSVTQRKQIVIFIDNVDQRSSNTQSEAFLIAQSIASNWEAVVFLSIRPNTFHDSKRSGSLSAYPNKIFYILPPRADHVLEKRINFAIKLSEGELPINNLKNISINLVQINTFFHALYSSLRKNPEIGEFLSNISGGNIRAMIDFVTKFTGSPNVDSDKIIRLYNSEDGYVIPLHEFTKAALLGDYQYFDINSSIAMNLFDVKHPDEKEHFLSALILGYLMYDSTHKKKEGFVSLKDIYTESQSKGFSVDQIKNALIRLVNKKLIETSERVTFEESYQETNIELPELFRITTIGAYHLRKWIASFTYLDAVMFDTPIFNITFLDKIDNNASSFDIGLRYSRTIAFRDYLSSVWSKYPQLKSDYFDWLHMVEQQADSFTGVQEHLRTRAKEKPNR